jgi:hypothetical protein
MVSVHPFIVCLRPIRFFLHPFLADDDAARLLRVSRTTSLALMPGFTFQQHVFVALSQVQMLRMRALYEAYDVRPTRMSLRGGRVAVAAGRQRAVTVSVADSRATTHPLSTGVLPEGLVVLHLDMTHCTENVEAGVLPDVEAIAVQQYPYPARRFATQATVAAVPSLHRLQGQDQVELPANVHYYYYWTAG